MATFVNISAAQDIGLRGRVMAAIERMQEARARRALYKQTVRELNSLTKRDLDDLGIHRSMITRIAYDAAYSAK